MGKQLNVGGGRTNDPEGLRRRLLDVAFIAFTTRGYHFTTMHDLKNEAGVSSGALAHHFPTKKEIGLAVLRDRVAEAIEQTWIAPIQSAATTSEGVQTVFDNIISALDERCMVNGCPLNNLALELSYEEEEFRVLIESLFTRWRNGIATKIRVDQQAGMMALELDPERTATLIVAIYSGAMSMAKAGQNTEPLKVCAAQLNEFMNMRSRLGDSLHPQEKGDKKQVSCR